MLLINPGSHVEGGTEEQARENARVWHGRMVSDGITGVDLVEEPTGYRNGRWTFAFRHTVTGVTRELEIHGLTAAQAETYVFRPRVYWRGGSCSTPDLTDFLAIGYVLAIVPAAALSPTDGGSTPGREG